MRRFLRTFAAAAWVTKWQALLVAIAATLIWITHFDRWTVASWQLPSDYYADAQETLARLKAASEGDIWPLRPQMISRLGAPYGADWNGYPAPDKPLMIALGALVHVLGLYVTANLGLLLAQISSALAFFATARWLRYRWEWAAAGALLFAYTYHTFHRGLAHFSLVFTWTVPLGLVAVWLVAGSRRICWSRPGAIFCIVAAVALGTANPYNLFFWLQLMGWAVVWQWLGARRRENVQIGLAAIATAIIAFLFMHAENWLYIENPDALPLLARNYGGTEMYALKPVEMFIPPAFHHWEWLAFFGHRYARWSTWRGEMYLPYLGLAGIAGFIWLVLATLRRLVARRPPPGQALSMAWIMSYATIGGFTNVLALFAGVHVFRATNRAAIFISAIVLFFLVGRLSRMSAAWPGWLRVAMALALAAFGVFEQLPKPETDAVRKALAAEVRADAQFGQAMEEALPAGAMVFQLPVLGFPEVQPPHRLRDYEHFRPYLSTRHLCFSYGATKTRSRSRWQRELEDLPTPALVGQLESYGFAALYINRKGYEDRAEKMLRDLAALGYTNRLDSRGGNQIAIVLHPATDPKPPLARSLTFGRGWHLRPDDGWRWAYEDAIVSYFNPYPCRIAVDLRLTAMGADPRDVIIKLDNVVLRNAYVNCTPTALVWSNLVFAPGVNRLMFCSLEPAIRLGTGRSQLRSFAIRDATVHVRVADSVSDSSAAVDRAGTSDDAHRRASSPPGLSMRSEQFQGDPSPLSAAALR